MSFKDVMGHEKPIALLQRAIRKDKVAHSYLFLGNEGIGKKWVALQFAKALNCLEGRQLRQAMPATIASPAGRSTTRLHPDVLILEPESQTLKVDQVRQMQRISPTGPMKASAVSVS